MEDIPIDRSQWNKLVDNNVTNTVFQTHEWFCSWWDTYGAQHKLVFLIAYDNDELIGFAPLMITSDFWHGPTLQFVGDYNADYCDFVTSRNRLEVIEHFISYLHNGSIKWNQMLLINIPEYSTTLNALNTIVEKKNIKVIVKTPVASPTMLLKGHESEALKKANKYSIVRHIKQLNRMGTISFESYYDKENILAYMEDFFNQHIQRYQLKHYESQFRNKRNKDFFYQLVNNFGDTGWLFMAVLKLDDTPLAYHFGFDYDNKYFWYKPTFNINYSKYSPGTILIRELIEHAINESRLELDFTIGDEPFKYRFCNLTRYNQNVAIYRTISLYHLSNIRQKAALLIKKFKKKAGHV